MGYLLPISGETSFAFNRPLGLMILFARGVAEKLRFDSGR